MNDSQNRVSVYCRGHRQSPAYYRVYQYFDRLEGIKVCYHTSEKVERRFMPIYRQPIYIKIYAYIYSVCVVLKSLLMDFLYPPKAIFILRRLVPVYSPFFIRILVKLIANKGIPVYWDFDDPILFIGEICPQEFNLLSRYSKVITVTHEGLRQTIEESYRNKVVLLPTTDGDLYRFFDEVVNMRRMESLKEEVRLVWVATNVNLYNLEFVASDLDRSAENLKQKTGKQLILNVVCNGALIYEFKHLQLNNIAWTRQEAIKQMVDSHIGIMPLVDNEATRGKGGFKLIQYQSIGLPAIGSSVGFNNTVIAANTGFLIDNKNSLGWSEAILKLSDPQVWIGYSNNAFCNWNQNFSYDKNMAFWKSQFE